SPGRTRSNASSTCSGVVTFVFLSKYCSRLPVYSGIRSMEWSLTAGMYVSRLPMPYCRPTVKPFASNACAQISAMIFDSGKSAEPTTIDLRSPEADPPPSGLELPHAAVTSASTVTRIARLRWCGVRRAGFMRTSFRRHLPVATITAAATCRRALAHRERGDGFIRCPKGQRWSHDQRSVRIGRPADRSGARTCPGRATGGDLAVVEAGDP